MNCSRWICLTWLVTAFWSLSRIVEVGEEKVRLPPPPPPLPPPLPPPPPPTPPVTPLTCCSERTAELRKSSGLLVMWAELSIPISNTSVLLYHVFERLQRVKNDSESFRKYQKVSRTIKKSQMIPKNSKEPSGNRQKPPRAERILKASPIGNSGRY